ncbi:MAG: hypothetical protein JOZ18_14995 [Chloroflexi bacterium]|nr:hypothetical protein [Chloroflexota bacterium]
MQFQLLIITRLWQFWFVQSPSCISISRMPSSCAGIYRLFLEESLTSYALLWLISSL